MRAISYLLSFVLMVLGGCSSGGNDETTPTTPTPATAEVTGTPELTATAEPGTPDITETVAVGTSTPGRTESPTAVTTGSTSAAPASPTGDPSTPTVVTGNTFRLLWPETESDPTQWQYRHRFDQPLWTTWEGDGAFGMNLVVPPGQEAVVRMSVTMRLNDLDNEDTATLRLSYGGTVLPGSEVAITYANMYGYDASHPCFLVSHISGGTTGVSGWLGLMGRTTSGTETRLEIVGSLLLEVTLYPEPVTETFVP